MKIRISEVNEILSGWEDLKLSNQIARQEAQLRQAEMPKLKTNFRHHRGEHSHNHHSRIPDGMYRRGNKKH